MTTQDVLVIGAGPAGAAASIYCAERGLSVALIDTCPHPHDRPGESLHPGVEVILRQLGVWDEVLSSNFERYAGHKVSLFGEETFIPFGQDASGPWLGIQANRAIFDAMLVRRAEQLGVRVVSPCKARAPIVEGDRVRGCSTTLGDIEARWTIDAAGGSHWLARKMQIDVVYDSPKYIAEFGYVRGSSPTLDQCPLFQMDSSGWTWMAKVGPDLYHWTMLSLSASDTSNGGLPAMLAGLDPVGPRQRSDVSWRRVDQCAGPGFFIAGDAAFVIDPASSHGVLRALMSGIRAASYIGQILSGEAESVCIGEYRQWLHMWYHSETSQLRQVYQSTGAGVTPVHR